MWHQEKSWPEASHLQSLSTLTTARLWALLPSVLPSPALESSESERVKKE